MNSSPAVEHVPLEPWDEVFYSLSHKFEGAGMGGVMLRVRGSIEAEPLRAALSSLQSRHPRLRARVMESSDGRHQFQFLATPPSLPFEIKDLDTDPLPWQEEASRLMSAPLDPAVHPLTRLLVLRNRNLSRCDVIFVAYHAIVDGRSVFRMVADLLEYYEDAEQNGRPPPVSSLPIVTNPHAERSGSLLNRLAVMAHLVRRRRANRKGLWTSLPRADDVPPHRLWAHSVYSEEATMALARCCRKEKTTMYAALFAAGACGLRATLPDRQLRIKCRFPMDIRNKLVGSSGPVTEDDLGNFFSGYENVYAIDGKPSFWDLARRVHGDVKNFTDGGGPSLVYNLVRSVKFPYKPRTLKRGTMFVSNYGVAAVRDLYGSLSLEECAIVFKNDLVGPALMVQSVVLQRRLNLSLSSVEVPEEFWGRLRAEILARLQREIGRYTA